MKLWRKMGNKSVVKTEDGYTLLTGRQFKHHQQMLSGMKYAGSDLLQSLCKKTPYVSRYVEEKQ